MTYFIVLKKPKARNPQVKRPARHQCPSPPCFERVDAAPIQHGHPLVSERERSPIFQRGHDQPIVQCICTTRFQCVYTTRFQCLNPPAEYQCVSEKTFVSAVPEAPYTTVDSCTTSV